MLFFYLYFDLIMTFYEQNLPLIKHQTSSPYLSTHSTLVHSKPTTSPSTLMSRGLPGALTRQPSPIHHHHLATHPALPSSTILTHANLAATPSRNTLAAATTSGSCLKVPQTLAEQSRAAISGRRY